MHLKMYIGLWCITPLLTIFQLYRGGSVFFGGGNRSSQRKPDMPQVTDKLYHIILYRYMYCVVNVTNLFIQVSYLLNDSHR
jgi:hypothetical protein